MKVRDLRQRKDDAYQERNRVVAALAFLTRSCGGKAWLGQHPPDPDWHPKWRTIVFVEFPGVGQMSWHVHDRDRPLLYGIPDRPDFAAPWDGHTTAEKYERLARLCR
jgi:hypothetical protein